MWESNLRFADSLHTYKVALGTVWKDSASSGTLIAASLPPCFSHPTFLFGSTISTTLLFASRKASGTACVYMFMVVRMSA